jgi:hypothetical protein
MIQNNSCNCISFMPMRLMCLSIAHFLAKHAPIDAEHWHVRKALFRIKEPTLMSHAVPSHCEKDQNAHAHFSICVLCARARPAEIAFSAANFLLCARGGVYFTINGVFVPTHKFYSIGHKSEFMNARERERDAHTRAERNNQGHDMQRPKRIKDFEVGDRIARDLCRHSNAAARIKINHTST